MQEQKLANAASAIRLPKLPFRVEFDTAGSCNLNCAYCYAQPLSKINPSKDTLQYLFSKTAAEVKPFEVLLLGGEPFIRDDIIGVIELAISTFKHDVAISTNGTLISELSEDELKRLKTATKNGLSIQVSLDSVKPTINDITRGKTVETLNGLKILEEHEIFFAIGLVMSAVNKDDILDTTNYLINNYKWLNGLNYEILQSSRKMANCVSFDKFKLEYRTAKRIQHELLELKKHVRDNVKFIGLPGEPLDEDVLFETYNIKPCTAGLMRSAVLTNGDVTPCANIRQVTMGNLFNESWVEIWTKAQERFANLDIVGSQCECLLRREVVK